MIKKLLVLGIICLAELSSVLAPRVLAGGGLIYLDARPQTLNWQESKSYIVRAYISPEIKCSNIPVTFKFVDPQAGDEISTPASGPDTGKAATIISKALPRYVNNKVFQDCTTYAKVFSGTDAERELYVEANLPDGTLYKSSSIILNFWQENPSETTGSFSTPWDNETKTANPSIASAIPAPDTAGGALEIINPSSKPISSILPSIEADQKTEELNKKITALENKVEQASKKQSILEQKIQDLVSFIKRILPFFK